MAIEQARQRLHVPLSGCQHGFLRGSLAKRRCHTSRASFRRGFTLLEAVLALMLTIILLSGIFAFFITTLRARQEGGTVTRDAMLARFVLQRMAEEIQHAVPLVVGDGTGFHGDSESIKIVTTRIPGTQAFGDFDLQTDDLPPLQSDLMRIAYFLRTDPEEIDPETGEKLVQGLQRNVERQLDPNPLYQPSPNSDEGDLSKEEDELGAEMPAAEMELVAPEIRYLRFEYFDGAQWKDRWQVQYEAPEAEAAGAEGVAPEDENVDLTMKAEPGAMDYALPQAVRITIGREPVARENGGSMNLSDTEDAEDRLQGEQYHEDRFTILVHLQQADPSLLSSRKHGVENQPLDENAEFTGLTDLSKLGGN